MFYRNFFNRIFAVTVCTLTMVEPASAETKKDISIIATQSYLTLDPHIGYDWLSYITLNSICGTLTGITGKTGKLRIINDLAREIEYVDDGYTMVVHLDPKRKFHNGQPVRANDVVYSLNRMLSPEIQSPGAPLFNAIKGYEEFNQGDTSHISGVSALDELTVRIELKSKSYSLPYVFATNFGCIIPDGFIQQPFDLPVSAGQMKAESFSDDGILILSRFHTDPPVYDAPYETIKIYSNQDENSILDLFAQGEADLVIDGLAWSIIRTKYKDVMDMTPTVPSQALTYLALNSQMPPLDDVKLRQAINYAINRDTLIEILQNTASATSQIVPPAFAEYDDSIPANIYDPKYAAELIEDYKKPIVLNLYTVDNPVFNEIVYAIAKDLRQIGITIVPKYGSHEEVLAIGSDATRGQMVFSDGLGWHPDYADVSNFYFPLLSPKAIGGTGWNWSAYNNPEIHELAQYAESLIEPENIIQRREIWKKIFRTVFEDAVMISLYNRQDAIFGYKVSEESITINGISYKSYVNDK